MKQRPSGICTALYRCPKCGDETYQAPNAVVEHRCLNNTVQQLKEIKQ